MIGSGFMGDLDNDLCGDFFDHIDDLLDFPIEDVEGGNGGDFGGECNGFQGTCWPPMADALAGPTTSIISGKNGDTSTTELPTELSVPYEDIAQLEWLSNFVEDSFSAGSIIVGTDSSSIGDNVINNENSSNNDSHQFQTSSPVSVLESSSSSSGGNGIGSGNSSGGFRTMPLSPEMFVPGRARSKRPRPATFNPRPHISLISPTSSATEDPYPFSTLESASELDNYAESFLVNKMQFEPNAFIPTFASETGQQQQQLKKKKKKKKLLPYPASSGATDQPPQPAAAVRKCLHCEITKTPQWRAGPLGPKTLCNACGVRYKSGRLFPEYRPAASPTFVSSLHSNSHKKVIEMRSKANNQTSFSPATTPATPELVPNNNPLLDYI